MPKKPKPEPRNKWKPGDPIDRKKLRMLNIRIDSVTDRQLSYLIKQSGRTQSDYFRSLIDTEYLNVRKRPDTTPTLVNAATILKRVVDDLAYSAAYVDFALQVLEHTAVYKDDDRHERIEKLHALINKRREAIGLPPIRS